MAPIFPHFKKLEQEDRPLIERITELYLPYSDFNFVSLYSWDTHNNTHFSLLNDNLVIRMKNYGTNDEIFSFLGDKEIVSTLASLMQFIKEHHVSSLSMIPETNIRNSPELHHRYLIEEDRDQYDYIYKISEMIAMEGHIYVKRRNRLRMFEKSYKAEVKELQIRDETTQQEIINLCNHWIEMKKKAEKYYDENEITAIKNCFKLANYENFICLGIYIDNKLAGFSLLEALPNHYCMFHFEKADHTYDGITEFIKVNTAKHLHAHGIHFMNSEQDLGIEGLRRQKLSYNPATFLKKYTIKEK